MRKFLCFLLALMLCLPLTAGAAGVSGSGNSCGESMTWTLSGSLLMISGKGEMYDYPNGAPWAEYRDSITTVILSGEITAVGGYAFKDYDNITSVDFGTSLVRIGAEAFNSCDGLTSITLPSSFKKFGSSCLRSCRNLHEIHMSGYFPRFDDGAVWDTDCTIYYPADNPWDGSTIAALESAFHYRISFRPSDRSESVAPAESVTIPADTEPPYVIEIIETTPAAEEARPAQPQPTLPPPTEPETTAPATVPTDAAESQAAPVTEAAAPPTAAPETQEAPLFAQPTRAAAQNDAQRATDGSSVYAILIIGITLSIIGIGSLLFNASRNSRHHRRR